MAALRTLLSVFRGRKIFLLLLLGFSSGLPLALTGATLQAWLAKSQRFTTVPVTNEGEGVAICAGAWLAGNMPVIVLETSGILLVAGWN